MRMVAPVRSRALNLRACPRKPTGQHAVNADCILAVGWTYHDDRRNYPASEVDSACWLVSTSPSFLTFAAVNGSPLKTI